MSVLRTSAYGGVVNFALIWRRVKLTFEVGRESIGLFLSPKQQHKAARSELVPEITTGPLWCVA